MQSIPNRVFHAGGFSSKLADDDRFGAVITSIGDLDNSGLTSLAVGAPGDDPGSTKKGATRVLFMKLVQ